MRQIPTRAPTLLIAAAALVLAAGACDSGPPEPTLFRAPIEGTQAVDWYYGALPNHSVEPATAEDYQCGLKAKEFRVNTAFIIPSLRAMDEGVNVLAAAGGKVVEVVDGNYDRQLTYQIDRPGNLVRIRHDDGIVSVYHNLKEGSIVVSDGQRVEAGQVIAQAGSSGDSDWPRVGFEAVGENGDTFDPWAGSCSGDQSYWAEQPDYPNEFRVIDSGTSDQPATLTIIAGRPPDVTTFQRGQDVTFWVHTLNRPVGLITLRLFGPDAPMDSVAFNYLQPDPANAIYGGPLQLQPDDPLGTWAIEYAMNDVTFARLEFEVTDTAVAATAAATTVSADTGRTLATGSRLRLRELHTSRQ